MADMLVLELSGWSILFFILFVATIGGCVALLIFLPFDEPEPRGLVDLAAELDLIELAAEAQEIETLTPTVPVPAFAHLMREVEQVANYAWWAREPDGEDEAPV